MAKLFICVFCARPGRLGNYGNGTTLICCPEVAKGKPIPKKKKGKKFRPHSAHIICLGRAKGAAHKAYSEGWSCIDHLRCPKCPSGLWLLPDDE